MGRIYDSFQPFFALKMGLNKNIYFFILQQNRYLRGESAFSRF